MALLMVLLEPTKTIKDSIDRHRQYSTGTARDDSWPPTETETFCQNSILMHKILS